MTNSRRHFLKQVFISVGGVILLSRCTFSSVGFWRFLTDEEALLLDAVADQIIPPDEWPGGAEAGVTVFIDHQLADSYRHHQADYRKGLAAIQNNSQKLFGKNFEQLPFDRQTVFLERMDQGELEGDAWAEGFDHSFFRLLRDHCLQGFYGSPRHGGNRNYISYKMLKLDYPLIIGRNKYNN